MPARPRLTRTVCGVVAVIAAAIATSTAVSSHTGVAAARQLADQNPGQQWLMSVRTDTLQGATLADDGASAVRSIDKETRADAVQSEPDAGVPAGVTSAPAAPPAAAPAPPPPAPAAQHLVVTAPPTSYRNRLIAADGSVNTAVGVYSDCSGRTALVRYEAAIDTCIGGVTYFVGHNPGVFTGLLDETAGSRLTYWDGNGVPHRMLIVDRRQWLRANGTAAPLAGASYEFQTCLNLSGSVEWIFDAVAA